MFIFDIFNSKPESSKLKLFVRNATTSSSTCDSKMWTTLSTTVSKHGTNRVPDHGNGINVSDKLVHTKGWACTHSWYKPLGKQKINLNGTLNCDIQICLL